MRESLHPCSRQNFLCLGMDSEAPVSWVSCVEELANSKHCFSTHSASKDLVQGLQVQGKQSLENICRATVNGSNDALANWANPFEDKQPLLVSSTGKAQYQIPRVLEVIVMNMHICEYAYQLICMKGFGFSRERTKYANNCPKNIKFLHLTLLLQKGPLFPHLHKPLMLTTFSQHMRGIQKLSEKWNVNKCILVQKHLEIHV